MKLILEQNKSQAEIEVIIKYPQKTKTVERIISLIKSADIQLPCNSDEETLFVNASDILYIESVDKKTVICCEKKIIIM